MSEVIYCYRKGVGWVGIVQDDAVYTTTKDGVTVKLELRKPTHGEWWDNSINQNITLASWVNIIRSLPSSTFAESPYLDPLGGWLGQHPTDCTGSCGWVFCPGADLVWLTITPITPKGYP